MLRITIGQINTEPEDVTDRLDADSDLVMDCVRTRDDFKRAFGDVQLRLDNRDSFFTKLFLSKHPSTWWDVEVWDEGRRNFIGRIESPINFSIIQEWTSIQVFSIDKLFWDRAQSAILYTWMFGDNSTIDAVLQQILFRFRVFDDLITGIEIDPIYQGRPVRTDHTRNSEGIISSEFTLKDVADNATVEQFLLDAATYYNAEFFIDPATKKLRMKQHQTVLNDVRHDLDKVLMDDNDVIMGDTDMATYDYVHLSVGLKKPDMPAVTVNAAYDVVKSFTISSVASISDYPFGNKTLVTLLTPHELPVNTQVKVLISDNTSFPDINRFWDAVATSANDLKIAASLISVGTGGSLSTISVSSKGFTDTFLGYSSIYVVPFGNVIIESGFSDPTGLISVPNDGIRRTATITFPPGPIGTTKRVLMRKYADTDYRIVSIVNDNTTTSVIDDQGNALSQSSGGGGVSSGPPTGFDIFSGTPPTNLPQYFGSAGRWSGDVWLRFDEVQGRWINYASVFDQGVASLPSGKIYELKPRMQSKTATPLKFLELLELFGSEQLGNTLYDQWKPIFLTHRKVTCNLNGKNYAVGDSGLSEKRILPNDFTPDVRLVIKNPKVHLTKDYTEAEMYTI